MASFVKNSSASTLRNTATGLLVLATALLAVPSHAAAAAGWAQRKSGAASVPELVKKIEESRKLAANRRLSITFQLTRLTTEEARRASLALLSDETNPTIRGRFLEHASKLPGLDDLMRRELAEAANLQTATTAATYLLNNAKRGRRLILATYEDASGRNGTTQRQAVLGALAQSSDEQDHKAFVARCADLNGKDLLPVLSRMRSLQGDHVDRVRRARLEDSYLPLRGLALQQLCARGDARALALARELADDKKRPAALASHLVESLFANPEREDLPRLGRILGDASSRISTTVVDRHIKKLIKKDFVKAWAVATGAEHSELAVRAFAVRLLEGYEGQDVRDVLLQITQSKDAALRRRAIFALAKMRDARVGPILEKTFAKGGLDDRIDALEGLAMIRGDDAAFRKRVLHLASSGPVPLRLVALDIGAKSNASELLAQLPSLLAAKDWRLRAGGIQLARDVRAKESVPQLIRLLAKEKGRLAEDTRAALASLTRLYYHQARDWDRWWKRDGKTFVLPPPEDKTAKKSSARSGNGNQVSSRTSATFYGIPVLSDRVVYCVDVSGSMSAQTGTGITRLKVAQEALIAALKSSPKQSLVNVIFFESGVHPYESKSISLKRKANLQELIKFTRRQTPRGGTNIHGALVKAMEDTRVDTIFLLSDGAPSAGEITDADQLVADIARRNRSRRIVFHCISIGMESAMLRKLAAATNGRYSRQ